MTRTEKAIALFLEGANCAQAVFSAFADLVNNTENQVFVLSYWLGNTIFSGAHAVTLVRRDGRLWAYNLFNQQTAPMAVGALSDLVSPERFIVGYVPGGAGNEA